MPIIIFYSYYAKDSDGHMEHPLSDPNVYEHSINFSWNTVEEARAWVNDQDNLDAFGLVADDTTDWVLMKVTYEAVDV